MKELGPQRLAPGPEGLGQGRMLGPESWRREMGLLVGAVIVGKG